ncbi:F-box/LRR-repeat protein [Trifolium medium]|uniref:F-box/LRR-repeat protein n=1 Tax=Trifolium medium TaxID=97028 RepID=A0A392MZX7_9FABA|nr:F-box/LRR-repeat protein [Trifolium medium]
MAAAKRKIAAAKMVCSYLPDELWERIFKSLDGHRRTLKSLSVVSKQFLSITNQFGVSLKITDETIPFLSRLFRRFPNLTSLFLLILSCKRDECDTLLTQISAFPLSDIKSLYLAANFNSNIPVDGLKALSKKMINLNDFTCLRRVCTTTKKEDLSVIFDCFPLLKAVKLLYTTYRRSFVVFDYAVIRDHDGWLKGRIRRRIDLSGIDRQTICSICKKKCDFLQEANLSKYDNYDATP